MKSKYPYTRTQLLEVIDDARTKKELSNISKAIAEIKDKLPLLDRIALQKQMRIRQRTLTQ